MQPRNGRTGQASLTQTLGTDQSGMALIYATVLLPVVIGFALLAVDVGRFTTLNSSLQHGADALALAGAAELDGRPDAIQRAEGAMQAFITSNTALFTSSAAELDYDSVKTCYLQTLPASDDIQINHADCLSKIDPDMAMLAKYLQVIVDPKTYNTIFPATFVGAVSNSVNTDAEAVAGFQAAVCDFTPMFICNPYEEVGNTNIADATELMRHFDRENYPDRIGRLINMKQTGGNSAQYFPGNFGFLIPQGGDANPGANTLREQVGMANPPACFVADGVELRTGAITSVRFGFNTRFDLYEGPMNGKKSDESFRPAMNVRKGVANDTGNPCNPSEGDGSSDPDFSKLPRDNCFAAGNCTEMNGRMGDGNWNRADYWKRAHQNAAWPNDLPANASRYDVYKYELEKLDALVKQDSNGTPAGGEVGYPKCWNGDSSKLSNTPDRRIFHAAILNCRALNASAAYGPITGGSGKKLPVVAFGRFFLTEPVLSASASSDGKDKQRGNQTVSDGDIFAEMVGIDEPGNGDGVARDIVQLYR